MQEFKVGIKDAGKRTDVFVAEQFPQYARSALRVLFEAGMVLVNSEPEEPGDKLKNGDVVSVDTSSIDASPAEINLPIIYEDNDVIVINKPSGILTHSKGAINKEATVASFIKNRLTDDKLQGNRAGIAHRLDRWTSGVIICAKNSTALTFLQRQFSQRRVKKTYIAIVKDRPEQESAIIDVPIERNPKRPQTFRAGADGKPAQTSYKIVKEFTKDGVRYSLLEVIPATGRTHQIRVHLKYIGHPIIGDRIYGTAGDDMLLHASKLEITLPSSRREVFTADTPQTIKNFAGL